jgi:hypothetical protein
MRRLSLNAILIFLAACASTQQTHPLSTDPAVRSALGVIQPNALQSHIEFLADDLLEGRETASRGYDLGAAYVASQFRQIGLEAGVDGGWYQRLPLRTAMIDREKSSMTLLRGEKEELLRPNVDYAMYADPARDDVSAEGGLVFAGYGLTSAELKRDDYAGIDARGKIVVLLSGAPSIAEHTLRAYYSDSSAKARNAAAHGAIGILTIRTPGDERQTAWERITASTGQSLMTLVEPSGPWTAVPEIRVSAILSPEETLKIFEGAPMSVAQIDEARKNDSLHGFDLPGKLRMRRVSNTVMSEGKNVVGVLRGSDPVLSREYIVVSAHLDHLGLAPSGDDRIYNGALDNGSGVATIIEVARAMKAMPAPPRRSILFVAFAGEEKGGLGSNYFARNPPLRDGKLVADINIDMFQMIFPVADMVSRGQQHSTLQKHVDRAARELGVKLSPDPEPEQVRLVRSDQYSFIKEGIPAMIIKAGFESSDPAIDGPKRMKEWTAKVYHSPADDTKQPIDYPSGVRFAQLNTLVAWYTANDPETPRWNEGDFFLRMFGKK